MKSSKRRIFRQFLLFIFLFSLSFVEAQTKQNYVVILSLDGFRWDYSQKYKTPNLNKMAKEGVKAKSLAPCYPSKTFPNHYSMATGLTPNEHGIIFNQFYDIQTQSQFSYRDKKSVQDPKFYGGEPIWITAEKQGLKSATLFWVGSEALIENKQPTYWKTYDQSISFETRADTVINWLKKPEEQRPQLIMWYYHEPDATGHNFGPDSEQMKQQVEKIDSLIGLYFKKIETLPFASKINLIVLSDHGMCNISAKREINLNLYLKDSWISRKSPENPLFLVEPQENCMDSICNALEAVEHIKIRKKGEYPEHLEFGTNLRIPALLIEADSSYSISWTKNLVNNYGGTHGYDNQNSDMQGIFYAKGPGFQKNVKTASFPNLYVYAIACKLLQLKPVEGARKISENLKMFR